MKVGPTAQHVAGRVEWNRVPALQHPKWAQRIELGSEAISGLPPACNDDLHCRLHTVSGPFEPLAGESGAATQSASQSSAEVANQAPHGAHIGERELRRSRWGCSAHIGN